jgi:hypothetical protein
MKALWLAVFIACLASGADLRLGIVGTDTSHVTAFTALLNDPNHKDHIPGARVVAAFKSGSPDVADSWNRVDKFSAELSSKWNVELVPDVRSLCGKVDAVLLESLDGRVHLRQAKEVFACGKPVFIDKPLASTLEDAREIARQAREAGIKWFSASSLRFSSVLQGLAITGMNGVIVWGPGPLEPHHQLDLSWYGVHTIEALYTLLGTGCEEVTRVTSADADVVTGKWKDGRIGVVRVNRPYSSFGAAVFSPKQIVQSQADLNTGYAPLLREIIRFFETGKAPVAEQETLEMFAFMDAAQQSKESGGKPVRLRLSSGR